MTHSDDLGLVLPPKLAPIQVVVVPIYKTEEQLEEIRQVVDKFSSELKAKGVSIKFDDDSQTKPGWKFAEYELKGVPVRIAIGPKDLEKGHVEVARRDTLEKQFIALDNVSTEVEKLLEDIQTNLFQKAVDFRDSHLTEASTFEEFKDIIENKGGFVSALWDGTEETEEAVKNATKATIRCIPQAFETTTKGVDVFSGKPAKYRVLYAKAY